MIDAKLAEGRHIRERRGALLRGNSQCADLIARLYGLRRIGHAAANLPA